MLETKDLCFKYPDSEDFALKDISVSVKGGEFILICGETGCGKSTLLKMFKSAVTPHGELIGQVLYNGKPFADCDEKALACEIGYVTQNPDNQIVTDKVWHELAFGLENLGVSQAEIKRRVAEMANYFGIQSWYRKPVSELSGGQKQLLNLAAVMVMRPQVLLLDEPTSRLDPIAAAEFINIIKKLNRKFGITVIIAEHNLEEVFSLSDKVLLMKEGRTVLFDVPKTAAKNMTEKYGGKVLPELPSAVRIYSGIGLGGDCPLTVRDGKRYLSERFDGSDVTKYDGKKSDGETAVEFKNVSFRYEKKSEDILNGACLKVKKGEIYCLTGGNGVGKTTALKLIAGLLKQYEGKIKIFGKALKNQNPAAFGVALLPQDPQTIFLKSRVYDDFYEYLKMIGTGEGKAKNKISEISDKVGITSLLNRHPFDLSGGEQQKCAVAKLLLADPEILLFDEPTKGLDGESKISLGSLLKELKSLGKTIVVVTHDIEFAAHNADTCAMLFDGEIIGGQDPHIFFAENSFYTTYANRIAYNLFPYAVTCDEVISECKKNKSNRS